MTTEQEDAAQRTLTLIEQIKPILAGHGSAVQGAALAELTAMWAAGHYPPRARRTLLSMHFEITRHGVLAIERERGES